MFWIVLGIIAGVVFFGWIGLIILSSGKHEENQNLDDRIRHYAGRG